MTNTLIYKRSMAIAVLAMLRLIMPAVIAIGMLSLLARTLDRPFGDNFLMLSVLLAVLAPVVLLEPAGSPTQFVSRRWSAAASLVLRWVVLLLILLLIGYVTKFSAQFSRLVIGSWAILTPIPLVLASMALNGALRRVMYSSDNARRAVFAGFNEVSMQMAERLKKHRELCISVDGFFDDRSAERLRLDGDHRLLGGLPTLTQYVKQEGIDVIFVALPMRHVQRVLDLLEDLRDTTASIYYVPDIFVFDLIQSRTGEILGIPVVAMCETPFYGYRGVVKRFTDVGSLGHRPAVACALPRAGRTAGEVDFAGSGDLPPAPVRSRRAGNHGLQVPDDGRDRGRRHHPTGNQGRRSHYAAGSDPAALFHRRAAATPERDPGDHEPGRAAATCRGPQ